jgi:hypothetical protein
VSEYLSRCSSQTSKPLHVCLYKYVHMHEGMPVPALQVVIDSIVSAYFKWNNFDVVRCDDCNYELLLFVIVDLT